MKNYLGYIPIVITILGIIITGFVRFNSLEAKSETTEKAIIKIENKITELEKEGTEDIKDLQKENNELDKAITEQTVKLEYIQKMLEKIDKKLP